MAREIPLTKGLAALVDDDLFDWLSQWSWYAQVGKDGEPYACAGVIHAGVRTVLRMHRVICPAPASLLVDHADGDTLNNQRGNLRIATARQNSINAYRAKSSSGFRGVKAPDVRGRSFRAILRVGGRQVTVGKASTAEEAARIYDAHARLHYGEFARLNFPDEGA